MASVDVIIPNYNYGRYLHECVESVRGQAVNDLRILIIDNASTDESVLVAQNIAKNDSRVDIVVHNENLGLHASWNEAIDAASADYFMILCSDDLLAPGALHRAIALMERDRSICFTHGQEITLSKDHPPPPLSGRNKTVEWRTMTGKEFVWASCTNPANYINGGTMVIRTAAQKRAGYFRSHLTSTIDLEMMLRLAQLGGVGETSAVQGLRRLHGANMSELYASDYAAELRQRLSAFDSFFANDGNDMTDRNILRMYVRKGIAERAYWRGVRDLSRGRIESALGLLKLSLTLRPLAAIVPPLGYLFNKRPKLNAFAEARLPISNLFPRPLMPRQPRDHL